MPNALLEIWQANAAGRYRHDVDRHPAPLDPNFAGAGRALAGADGSYRFVTVKPGAYPWRNHPNAWRPAHIHFSIFGRAFTQRLVTQMYFPGDPLFEFDPIFNSVRDPRRASCSSRRFDLDTTEPEWALAYRFDIVLRAADAVRAWRTPSQTVGPYFSLGLAAARRTSCPDGTVRLAGRVLDGEGARRGRRGRALGAGRPASARRDRRRRRFLVPRAAGAASRRDSRSWSSRAGC